MSRVLGCGSQSQLPSGHHSRGARLVLSFTVMYECVHCCPHLLWKRPRSGSSAASTTSRKCADSCSLAHYSFINFVVRVMRFALRKRCKIKKNYTHFNLFHYPSCRVYRARGFSNLNLLFIKVDHQRWSFHLKNEILHWNLIPLYVGLQRQRCRGKAIFFYERSH